MILDNIRNADLSRVAIFSGAGVDPDGLASQLTMKAIVEELNGEAKVSCFFRGTFNRPQNKTMREVLALNVKPDTDVDLSDNAYTCVISVDGGGEVCPIEPDFIIDHHKPGRPARIATDVRQIGSASAILCEYARAAGINFETDKGRLIATALALGILTDTNYFREESCSALDFESAAFCLGSKDHKAFLSIVNWPKPAYYNDMFAQGWANKIWEGTVLVAGLGAIPEGRSGIISDLAEKFCETNGVSTSVVVAIVDNHIVLSVRSSNSSLDVNEFVKTTFGNGGGKRGAGAARIPLPEPLFSNVGEGERQKVFDSFFSIIVSKVLEFAGDGARQALIEKEP